MITQLDKNTTVQSSSAFLRRRRELESGLGDAIGVLLRILLVRPRSMTDLFAHSDLDFELFLSAFDEVLRCEVIATGRLDGREAIMLTEKGCRLLGAGAD